MTLSPAAKTVTHLIYFHSGKVLEVDKVERSEGPDLPYRRGESQGSVPKADVKHIFEPTRHCDRPKVGDPIRAVRVWVACIDSSATFLPEGDTVTITFQDPESGETFRVSSAKGVIIAWEGTPGTPPPARASGPPQRIYLKDGRHIDPDRIEFVGQGEYVRWVEYTGTVETFDRGGRGTGTTVLDAVWAGSAGERKEDGSHPRRTRRECDSGPAARVLASKHAWKRRPG